MIHVIVSKYPQLVISPVGYVNVLKLIVKSLCYYFFIIILHGMKLVCDVFLQSFHFNEMFMLSYTKSPSAVTASTLAAMRILAISVADKST